MKSSENYKRHGVKSYCNLAVIVAFLVIFNLGCRAQQTQTAPEKNTVPMPAVNSSPAQTRTPKSVKKDSEQNTSFAAPTGETVDRTSVKVVKSGDLDYLKQWVGKYTFGSSTKRQKSFFALPQIRTPLQNLLGAEKFKKLLDGFTSSLPAQEQENYLVLEGTSDKASEHLVHSLVTVNLENGKLATAFVTQNSDDSTFESYGNFDELPAAIQKRIKDYIYPSAK